MNIFCRDNLGNEKLTKIKFFKGPLKQMNFSQSLKTALGMSFISMISMEIAMNTVDWWLTGGANLTWWVIPIMLIVGFITPWPYNYWRLKKFDLACH